jgi:hypothetical protein
MYEWCEYLNKVDITLLTELGGNVPVRRTTAVTRTETLEV